MHYTCQISLSHIHIHVRYNVSLSQKAILTIVSVTVYYQWVNTCICFFMKKRNIEMVPKVVRHFPQKRPVGNETGESKGQLSRDILAGVSVALS